MKNSFPLFRLMSRIAAALCAVSFASSYSSAVTFQPLGDLGGGDVFSVANGVSADGTVVVGSSDSANGRHAIRWTAAGGLQGLGDLAGGQDFSTGNAISANGAVIVGRAHSDTLGETAYRWTESEGMQALVNTVQVREASAVSSDGTTVVGYRRTHGNEGFRWSISGGIQFLGYFPGGRLDSIALGVSYDGSVIAGRGFTAGGDYEAYRWTAADGLQGLGDLAGGAFASAALAVSGDGITVVGVGNSPNGPEEAFRWSSSTGMLGLGDIPGGGFASVAYAASADGSTIVGSGTSAIGKEASIWTLAAGMRSIRELLIAGGSDLTGWTLTEARGVSADGTVVVGTGLNPDGQREGWIANLAAVPEPAWTLYATGCAIALLRSRFRNSKRER